MGERELRQCELCGAMTRNWQEHHYDYQRHRSSTVTLCLKCHKLADERRRKREAIQLNKPLPPEPPIDIEISWIEMVMPAIFLRGFVFFVLMVLMTEVVHPFYISVVVTFLLLYGGSEFRKRNRKKRQEEYQRRLAEWEKQQGRPESEDN